MCTLAFREIITGAGSVGLAEIGNVGSDCWCEEDLLIRGGACELGKVFVASRRSAVGTRLPRCFCEASNRVSCWFFTARIRASGSCVRGRKGVVSKDSLACGFPPADAPCVDVFA